MTITGLNHHQLDLLAQAVSFTHIDIDDLVPYPRRTARLSKTYRTRAARAMTRLRELEQLGLLEAENVTETRFAPTVDARAALEAAGFAPDTRGCWLKVGAEHRPGWAS